MVRGTTKQVVVVNGVDKNLFEQAIFLVRDDVLMNGGVTEEALLEQVRESCTHGSASHPTLRKLLWSLLGAGITGLIWAAAWILI